MKRRTVLKQATVVAGTFAAAGCLSGGSGSGYGESTTTDEGDEESTAESTETASMASSVASKSVETTGTTCGSENAASVSFEDGGVSVEGDVPASNPCHEAVFREVVVEDGALSVTMALKATDADTCQSCLGQMSYAAGVEVDGGELSSVTVKHVAQGETTVVAEVND